MAERLPGRPRGGEDTRRIKCRTIGVSLPEDLITIIEEIRRDRCDPKRSNTIKDLLLERISQLQYTSNGTKKSLGNRA